MWFGHVDFHWNEEIIVIHFGIEAFCLVSCHPWTYGDQHEDMIYVPFQFHHEHCIYIAPYIFKKRWKRNMFHKCQYDYWWSYYIYYCAYYISTKLSHFLNVFEGISHPRISHGYFFFFCSFAWCFFLKFNYLWLIEELQMLLKATFRHANSRINNSVNYYLCSYIDQLVR